MNTTTVKPPRSVRLTKKEIAALKLYKSGFESDTRAALSIGIDRMVLNRVLTYGSGSYRTIQTIREKLNSL